MLPFTKRTARDDGEVINTAEIEVLRSASRPLRAVRPQATYPRSGRAPSNPTNPVPATRATRPSASDEEMTRLVPRAMAPASSRSWSPPASSAPLASTSLASTRPAARDDDETLVLPAPPIVPTISPFPSARAAEARAARAAKSSTPAISPDSIPPMALTVPASGAAGTVITNRPRVQGRPTAIWTVALVAMGLFAGLASSVVARGDADSIIDATASFVDPARAGGTRAATPVAAAQVAVAPIAVAPAPVPVAPIIGYVPASTNAQPPAAPVAAADLPAAPLTASRDRLPPVAYAASAGAKAVAAVKPVTARRTPRWTATAPKVATNNAPASGEPKATDEAKESKDLKVAVAEAPAPKVTKAQRGTRHTGSDDELASASAANELARAQLEAALR